MARKIHALASGSLASVLIISSNVPYSVQAKEEVCALAFDRSVEEKAPQTSSIAGPWPPRSVHGADERAAAPPTMP